MKRLILWLAISLTCTAGAMAQFGNFGDVPIEIYAEHTGMERNIATADENVVIHYGETVIYCDHAQYNPETRDVLVQGSVRIYREGRLLTGERAVYNLESKQLTAADFRGAVTPYLFAGDSLSTLGTNAYMIKDAVFTTSDNSKPDYYIKAKSARVYPNDRVIFRGVKIYVGRTPIFWLPYVYQSLNKEQGFLITPGYTSVWGLSLLGQYTFPIGEMSGRLHLDVMSSRGVGVGFDAFWGKSALGHHPDAAADEPTAAAVASGAATAATPLLPASKRRENWGRFRSYFINDANPGTNKTSLSREPIDPNRYRVSLQDRTYLTEDIYASIDINKLSDARFLQDFVPNEFRRNPNPDNMVAVTKWDENYAGTFIVRKNLNEEHFDATERLPEGVFEMKRQPLWGSRFFYESETSAGYYRRNFAGDSPLPDYDSVRADTFHQITMPQTYFGWLSLVPRAGLRGTYYSDTGKFEDVQKTTIVKSKILDEPDTVTTTTLHKLNSGGSVFRPVVNAGMEASFKFSRAFEQVQSRAWGLDGLRHVVQPYANASFVYSGQDPEDILQLDRINRSTQLPPLDFPQFNAIDAIDNWSVLRLGVRNRLQTRRDSSTLNWLELNTFVDVEIDRPDFLGAADPGTFSNVFNRLRWTPLPWVSLNIDSQLPLLDTGFTEVNSNLVFMVNPNIQLNVGQRYIHNHPLIQESNQVTFGGYFRFNDNWAFSFRERYELADSVLESQRYEIHRDLSSWVASLGFVVADNRGVSDYGVTLTFTLKDFPSVHLPLLLDPESLGGATGSGSGSTR